jgi:glycine oxidase
MTLKIGIVGAGLLGRLTAFRLARKGMRVTIFDRDSRSGKESCSWAGAGMLTPFAELEHAEPQIARDGLRSLELWPGILRELDHPVYFQREGSLVVAHRQDRADLMRFVDKVQGKLEDETAMVQVDQSQLADLEPELGDRFARAVYFPTEGQLEPRMLLPALEAALTDHGVTWLERTEVQSVREHEVATATRVNTFDWVIDTRGLGARMHLRDLRGVRGELIRVHAPEVKLRRPVRLMHPRYPLYIVPRPEDTYLIGATSIESEDNRAITVKSCLELLSAAYSLHPGFAEAEIIEALTGHRPAFPDNMPRIEVSPGLVRANGLYRHGFLIAPALVERVIAPLIQDQTSREEVHATSHA